MSPASINEGGVGNQDVTYTYTVKNTSPASTDPVTVTSLVDDKAGDLLAAFTAANGGSAVLAPGASVSFTLNQHLPVKNADGSYTNIVTVTGHDDENDTATDTATATVQYDESPSVSPASINENDISLSGSVYSFNNDGVRQPTEMDSWRYRDPHRARCLRATINVPVVTDANDNFFRTCSPGPISFRRSSRSVPGRRTRPALGGVAGNDVISAGSGPQRARRGYLFGSSA